MKVLARYASVFCFSLFFSAKLFAQFNPLIAYTPKTQVIYTGWDNPIAVTLGEYKLSEVSIKVSEGSIRKDNIDGKYLWRICNSNSEFVYLNIYCKKNLVKRFRYETKEILSPAIISDCCVGMEGSRHLSKNTNALKLDYGDALMSAPSKILNYSIEFADSSYNIYRILYNDGERFTKAVKNELNKILDNKSGIVNIYNIRIQIGCEEKPRILPFTMCYKLEN